MKKLLIVDMQKGFITKNNKFLVKNIEKLLKNGNFDQIIATKFVNNKKSQYEKFLDYTKFCAAKERELAIALPKDSLVFEKTSYKVRENDFVDAFSVTDEVYLCGTDYDSCVLAIAFQLFDFGILPHIVLDCVGSHSENPISKEAFEKLCLKNFGRDSLFQSIEILNKGAYNV